ncbi:MAG TPA: hypothetical protein VHC18_02920 [Amycolatopsis sp.]|nr:hypothetical protein [Amycolatopsis sp.]
MSFFDGIDFVVSDAAKAVGSVGSAVGSAAQAVSAGAAAGAAVAGGGVTMDRDEMTAFLQQVKQTQALCQQQVRANPWGGAITPPAQDQASAMFTNAAVTSREARNQYLSDQLKMYNELVDKLEKALGLTTESDQQAADTVNQAAGGGIYS